MMRTAAFFDVDETVIRAKSMFEFLRFWLARHGDDGAEYDRVRAGFTELAASGVPRSEVNRSYYRGFAGVAHEELFAAGRKWYSEYRSEPTAFVRAGLDALERHREAGDLVCLVSGSFAACLGPLAEDVGADVVLCTEPVVDADGLLTGEVVRPMIGDNKRQAVAETIAAHGLVAADCHAYGDHLSDLEMLLLVGRPHVIDWDPALVAHARTAGWPVLSAETGPLPMRSRSAM